MIKLPTLLIFIILFLFACDQQDPLSPVVSQQELNQVELLSGTNDDSLKVNVMTRNIYVGTDVDTILTASHPSQIPPDFLFSLIIFSLLLFYLF